MVASHAPAQTMLHRRAAETVLRYLFSSAGDLGRRAGEPRLAPEARALIWLAGNAAVAQFEEQAGLPQDCARAARREQSFCRIADAQGWDDRDRDRLEHLVETLLDKPAIQGALAAWRELRARRGRVPDAGETRRLLAGQLEGLSLELDHVRAALLEAAPPRRRPRRLRPGERPLPASG